MNPVIYSDGTKTWINKKGQLHRTDGPAYEYADGSKSWYLNGVRHRTDGPAIERDGGFKSWYLNGHLLTENLFLKLTRGPVKSLPLYLGMGFDQYISERLKT
jgi:hypothetical protein